MELWQVVLLVLLPWFVIGTGIAIGFGCYARGRSDWQVHAKRPGVMEA